MWHFIRLNRALFAFMGAYLFFELIESLGTIDHVHHPGWYLLCCLFLSFLVEMLITLLDGPDHTSNFSSLVMRIRLRFSHLWDKRIIPSEGCKHEQPFDPQLKHCRACYEFNQFDIRKAVDDFLDQLRRRE